MSNDNDDPETDLVRSVIQSTGALFEKMLPEGVTTLVILYNEHAHRKYTVAQAVRSTQPGYGPDDWVSPSELEKAIITNECWTLRAMYEDEPDIVRSASSMDALLYGIYLMSLRKGKSYDG